MNAMDRVHDSMPALQAMLALEAKKLPAVAEWVAFVVAKDDAQSVLTVLPRAGAMDLLGRLAEVYAQDAKTHEAVTQVESSPGPDAMWVVVADGHCFVSMRLRRLRLSAGGTA